GWWRTFLTAGQMTVAHYGAIVSTVAILLSCGSLYFSKVSYDLSSSKEEREQGDKIPAVDIQVRPAGASSAAVTVSVI
ncbi:MAG: hypothetical protein WB463_18380, partial [Pseudolabrys sp.]